MGVATRNPVRLLAAVLLALLGIGYFLFATVNFGYVDRLPDNLDVLIEGLSASLAAASLFWAALKHIRQQHWGGIVLLGSVMFLAGMVTSVLSGASTPSMFQVVVPIFTLGILRRLTERLRLSHGRSTSQGHP